MSEAGIPGANVIRRDLRDEDLHDLLTSFYSIIAADPLLAR